MQYLFPRKKIIASKITLKDSKENIISDDTLVSERLNNVFFFKKYHKMEY